MGRTRNEGDITGQLFLIFLKFSPKDMVFDFRGREKHRRERNINESKKYLSAASTMCPDQASNLQPFGVWNNAPTN